MIEKYLNKLTYSQKENYLIDCKGYSENDLIEYGEIGLDNILRDNNWVVKCVEFNNKKNMIKIKYYNRLIEFKSFDYGYIDYNNGWNNTSWIQYENGKIAFDTYFGEKNYLKLVGIIKKARKKAFKI